MSQHSFEILEATYGKEDLTDKQKKEKMRRFGKTERNLIRKGLQHILEREKVTFRTCGLITPTADGGTTYDCMSNYQA